MGIGVENVLPKPHRAAGYTGHNDYFLGDHRGDVPRDDTSPRLVDGDYALLYHCARDPQKTQADFDTLASGLGNGVGSWYDSRVTDFKTTLRDFFIWSPG